MKNEIIKFSDWLNFQPKQRYATEIADTHQYTLYGGAGGGGKSYWMRKYLARRLIKLFKITGIKNIVAGLFCEDYPAMKDRHLSKIAIEFPEWLGQRCSDHKDYGNSFILNPEFGSGVIAFRNLDDPSKYKSSEFAIEAVDELTKNPRETFDLLRSRMRWPGLDKFGLKPQFIAGTNPGEIGHGWVKKLWIDRDFETELLPIKEEFAFIPATVDDNKYVGEDYVMTLESLPEKLRKALRYGNWDVFEGQYFMEWNKDRHVCVPFAIPTGWRKFRAYDHGREAPACCKWYALDQDGRVWNYRELYVRGMNVDQIATEINRLSGDEQYQYSVADPSIFSSTGFVDRTGGQTIAEVFARYGVQFMPASNRRVDGWNTLHQYLFWSEIQMPKIMYFNTCFNSIRTIPTLVHDDARPEDLNTKCEDHAADCDRYFLMSLHEMKGETPKTDIEKKLEAWKKQDSVLQNLTELYMPK